LAPAIFTAYLDLAALAKATPAEFLRVIAGVASADNKAK
jgi:hypothetical protein